VGGEVLERSVARHVHDVDAVDASTGQHPELIGDLLRGADQAPRAYVPTGRERSPIPGRCHAWRRRSPARQVRELGQGLVEVDAAEIDPQLGAQVGDDALDARAACRFSSRR
jgi:hypothetical protein